uniref:S-acyltransferase n=1 Tax=Dunaliella tertiolecta TaxID=3047 RepID=A0A7S3R7B0_DUNTE
MYHGIDAKADRSWCCLFEWLCCFVMTNCHRVLSRVSVGICAALFIAACTSDPGTVTAGNVAAHNKLYPCNDRLWPKKFCKTCKFYRPARSKHCRVCRVCVARYDHHCAWINNCVGLGNMRIFLAFLAANASVTGYAAVIGCLALGGRLKAMGVLGHARVLDWRTGHVVMIRPHSIRTQLRYALGMSPIAAACTIFLALASLLLFTFLAYQLLMIAQGCTQYESDRRFSVHESSSRRAKQQAAPATSDGKSEREKVGRGGFKQTAPYVFLIGGIRWVLSCGKGGRGIKKHERVFHGIREPNMRGYDLDFVHNLRPWAALQQAEAQLLSSKQQEQQDKREKHE